MDVPAPQTFVDEEQIIENLAAQIADMPVPQTVDEVVQFERIIDFPASQTSVDAEQIIENL
eukprot:3745579-Amphidinium_carterae.1